MPNELSPRQLIKFRRLQRLKYRIHKLTHKGQPAPLVRIGPKVLRVRRWSEDRAVKRMLPINGGDILVPAGHRYEYRRAS